MFFVNSLLHLMSHAPTFCHIKGLIKIHNHGKFDQYSICGCQVENFQSFAYRFSIHEMAVFEGFFWPLLPQIWYDLLKFSPDILLYETKRVFEYSFKILNFYGNETDPKFAFFGPTLTPPLPVSP